MQEWQTSTSDKWILQTINGYRVELDTVPLQYFIPKPLKFCTNEYREIQKETDRFLDCGIIEEVENLPCPGEFI